MIALRGAHPALRQGTTLWLRNADEAQVLTYLRQSKDEEILVAVNLSNRPFTGVVEVGNGAAFEEITPEIRTDKGSQSRTSSLPALTLDPWGYRLFRRASKG
jgi:glycosidase